MPGDLNKTEEEVVLLKVVKETIDSMVNFEVLDVTGVDPNSNIFFHSATHQKFFNIVLVDFLSVTDRKGPIKPTSYLSGLRAITTNPYFDVGGSVTELRRATNEFTEWLNQVVSVDVWLPAIDTQTVLNLKRVEFIKICGDLSKHNVLRSAGVAEDVKTLLSAAGITVELEDALLVLSDFYARFHTDILNYHSGTIAEFLNNIRWGLYHYLQPEFERSIVWDRDNPPFYHYDVPVTIVNRFAKECYWELMNEVRSAPYVRKFQVTKWLKLRY